MRPLGEAVSWELRMRVRVERNPEWDPGNTGLRGLRWKSGQALVGVHTPAASLQGCVQAWGIFPSSPRPHDCLTLPQPPIYSTSQHLVNYFYLKCRAAYAETAFLKLLMWAFIRARYNLESLRLALRELKGSLSHVVSSDLKLTFTLWWSPWLLSHSQWSPARFLCTLSFKTSLGHSIHSVSQPPSSLSWLIQR